MSAVEIPLRPTSELFNRRQLAERHPGLLPESRIIWADRNRRKNGLEAAGAVFESAGGEHIYHEPSFLRWFLGLSGRAKPRAVRRGRGRAAAVSAEAR